MVFAIVTHQLYLYRLRLFRNSNYLGLSSPRGADGVYLVGLGGIGAEGLPKAESHRIIKAMAFAGEGFVR
jgi:hypothetical protein